MPGQAGGELQKLSAFSHFLEKKMTVKPVISYRFTLMEVKSRQNAMEHPQRAQQLVSLSKNYITFSVYNSVIAYRDSLILHCTSLLRTIFALVARLVERKHLHNVENFPQAKLDSEMNVRFLLYKYCRVPFFIALISL